MASGRFRTTRLLTMSCGVGGQDAASAVDCPAEAGSAETPEPVDDPVEAITEEFAKSGAQREDGGIVESSIDDPNFGGVYQVDGEVVVAVVDCASADVATTTALAGEAQLRVIEVDHNYREVNDFRDQLVVELR